MADETFMTDVTPESIKQANVLLDFLVTRIDLDWNLVMKQALNEKEYEINARTIEDKVKEFKLDHPLGAIVGGTGIAKDRAGMPGEEGQRAIRLLKLSGRLVQCGRGRGKCLVILRKDHLDEAMLKQMATETKQTEETKPRATKAEAPAPTVPENIDVEALLKMARDQYREVRREYSEAIAAVRAMERQVEELQAILNGRNETITRLEAEMNQRVTATWQ